MSDSPLCSDRGCRIEIRPEYTFPDGWVRSTIVLHCSEPVWYTYVDSVYVDDHGMIRPDLLQRLARLAEEQHRYG